MKNIIEEWKSNSNTRDNSRYLGCGLYGNESINNGFAAFAAYSLQKRFHFLRFFVLVGHYNELSVRNSEVFQKQGKVLQCVGNNFQHFTYKEENAYSSETILILTTFINIQNINFDWHCLFDFRLHCDQWNILPGASGQYQILCTMPADLFYNCGYSIGYHPFDIKQCLNEKVSILGACV